MNPKQKQVIVRDVWASNLQTELSLIQAILPHSSFASFDTEFPGTIFTPNVDKHFYSKLPPSTNYHIMKANVDALKIIQIGLTLSDLSGNLPNFGTEFGHIWQFNFCDFDIEHDHHNPESIKLLQKQGIDFLRNKKEGIPSSIFRRFLIHSKLLFNMSRLTWVTFHSGYDFGFFVKLVMRRELPPHIHGFRFLVARIFGPNIYDMKHIMKFCNGLYGGLDRVAKSLNVDRVAGKSHQAGSDSLLTLHTFLKLKDVYFNENSEKQNINLRMFQGILYGFEINTIIIR